MKTKFTIINAEKGDKTFYIKRDGKAFVAICDNQEYLQLPVGTFVNFRGQNRIVTEAINAIDMDGMLMIIEDKGKFAGPKIIPSDTKIKIKSSFVRNNLRAGAGLLIGFFVIMIVIMIIAFI